MGKYMIIYGILALLLLIAILGLTITEIIDLFAKC